MSLPIQAIAGSEKDTTVFLVNGNKRIEERPVKLGIETATRYEILSGLQENDLVIIGSRSALKVGQPVDPRPMDVTDIRREN